MVSKKRNILHGILLIIITILLIWVVMAVAGEGIRIVSPAANNFSNFSNSSSMLLNVTFANGTDITIGGIGNINQTTINASFYYNLSGTWTFLGNSSTCSRFAYYNDCF